VLSYVGCALVIVPFKLKAVYAYINQEGAGSSAKQDVGRGRELELEVSLAFTLDEIPMGTVQCSLGIGDIRILSYAISVEDG